MSDDRKRPAATGPDEADYLLWDTADVLDRLRRHNPAVARQAARAGLEEVKGFEVELERARATKQRQQRASYSE